MIQKQLLLQLQNLNDLQVLLEEEKACLTKKDFSNFSEVISNKQKSLQKIANLDIQLANKETLEKITQDDVLSALRNDLEKTMQHCQIMNNVNGKLIQLSIKSNKHLLQLITQAAGQNSITYDQKGALNAGQLLGKNIQA